MISLSKLFRLREIQFEQSRLPPNLENRKSTRRVKPEETRTVFYTFDEKINNLDVHAVILQIENIAEFERTLLYNC